MHGSILRGSDALISDARAKVSETKTALREALRALGINRDMNRAGEYIREALAVLNELDDRS